MSITMEVRGSLPYHTSSRIPVPHAFTTRLGGVSTGHLASLNLGLSRGDSRENVVKSFHILAQAVGFDADRVVGARQVHGKTVRQVFARDAGAFWQPDTGWECDGLMTNVPGLPLAVFSADCGTVLLYDPVKQAIAAVHSGWKGTALGIASQAVQAMTRAYATDPGDLIAALGPCIGACCFETDQDVPAAMTAALGDLAAPALVKTGDKYHVDLKRINCTWLEQAGVRAEHIDVSDACTACQPELYWSYRRHRDSRGSLAAVICLP